MALLEVEDLTVNFRTNEGALTAVNRVGFSLERGRVLGIVGESGSGKTQILLGLMGLLAPNGTASGRAVLNGTDLLSLSRAELNRQRGAALSMIFQDPMTALNPYMRIGPQLTEVLTAHQQISGAEAERQALAMLRAVQLSEPERRMRAYPHELSGGMRQRVMISMALLCRPALLLADEPTTALDVTIQAQILDLLEDLAAAGETSVVIVTHDLGVVARLCDEVIVLYGGRIMESAPADLLFVAPRHPYTAALLNSIPRLDQPTDRRLETIPGQPPSPMTLPPGCPFEPRCAARTELCAAAPPPLTQTGPRALACHHPLP